MNTHVAMLETLFNPNKYSLLMLTGFENQLAISSWKLEGLMLLFLCDWLMYFTEQTRTHTAGAVPSEK